MKRIETSVVIEKPVEQVFAYLIEPENLPKWAPGYLEAASTSDGPIRVGSTSKRVANYGGGRSESEHTVTEFNQNEHMVVDSKSGPLQIKEIYEVRGIDKGTNVVIAEEVTAPLLLKPAEWIFALMSKGNIDKYGKALKATLEQMN